MAGVHGLKHVEGFLTTALAKNDAVGTHAKRVLWTSSTLSNLTVTFGVWRAGLHASDMGLLELEFGCVLDRDQALMLGNERR